VSLNYLWLTSVQISMQAIRRVAQRSRPTRTTFAARVVKLTTVRLYSNGGQRVQGSVKFWNSVKGYGFITRDDNKTDLFVHVSGIAGEGYKQLSPGQRVSFVVEDSKRGPVAAAVASVEDL